MLIAILTILFLGGGTTAFLEYIADSKDAVKTVMIKDERQQEALIILKEMKKRTNGHNKQVKKTIKDLGKRFEGREDNTAEIATIADQYFKMLESYSDDILDLRFELKENVTRAEWAQIFPEE